MANVIINDENLTNIATAIREKNGETTTYKPSEMAAAIQAIAAGGGGEFNFVEAALTSTNSKTGYTGFNVYDYVDSTDNILCLILRSGRDYTDRSSVQIYIKGYNFYIENETHSPFSSSNPATMLGIIANPANYAYSKSTTFAGYGTGGCPALAVKSDGALLSLVSYYNNSSYSFQWNDLSDMWDSSYAHVWMLYK